MGPDPIIRLTHHQRCCPQKELSTPPTNPNQGGVTQYEPAHHTVWPLPVLSTQPASTLTYELQYARLQRAYFEPSSFVAWAHLERRFALDAFCDRRTPRQTLQFGSNDRPYAPTQAARSAPVHVLLPGSLSRSEACSVSAVGSLDLLEYRLRLNAFGCGRSSCDFASLHALIRSYGLRSGRLQLMCVQWRNPT